MTFGFTRKSNVVTISWTKLEKSGNFLNLSVRSASSYVEDNV